MKTKLKLLDDEQNIIATMIEVDGKFYLIKNSQEAAELTKPLFSIPAYQFLFHPGTVDGGKYREALQLEECEYGVVRSCARGNCLFKCGDERYNLLVKTPPHKLRCYGTAGGR